MGWKELPFWLKGGIIGCAIGITWYISIFICINLGFSPEKIIHYGIGKTLLSVPLVLLFLFSILAGVERFMSSVLTLILLSLTGFIIGALTGLIIGKIKKIKQKKKEKKEEKVKKKEEKVKKKEEKVKKKEENKEKLKLQVSVPRKPLPKLLPTQEFPSFKQPTKPVVIKPERKTIIQLKVFVNSSLKKGYTKLQIRQAALKAGWPKEEIENALKGKRSKYRLF